MILLAYGTVLQSFEWDASITPSSEKEYLQHSLFAAPAAVLAVMAFAVPIILNPYILGWPFVRQKKANIPIRKPPEAKHTDKGTLLLTSSKTLEDNAMKSTTANDNDDTFLTADEIDLETGSLTTNDLRLTFMQSPERLGQPRLSKITSANTNDVMIKNTGRLMSVYESRNESGGRRRRSQPTVEQSLERADTARLQSDSLLRRTVPLKGPSRDGPYNSPPLRRLEHGNKSPSNTPHSPIGRRNVSSISPGRRRQHSAIKPVKSDEWGFPMSINTTV